MKICICKVRICSNCYCSLKTNMFRQFFILLILPFLTNGELQLTCEHCDPNWTPFPNMVAAMRGYNLLYGDPWHKDYDTGFANQIFLPTRYEEGKVSLDPAITASDIMNCHRSLKVKSFATTESLR